MLCLYLGFPPSCFFFAAGRIGLLWAQLLCLCTPPVLWDGSLSVVRRLHHCPLTLLVPFPPLINILRVCSSYENLTCRLFFLSRVLLFLFIPLIPKLGNCSTACHQVCHMKVFCVSETLSSLSFVMGFPSRSILCPFFSSDLLPWFQCFIPCPHPFSFSASIFSYLLTISTQVSVSAWLKPNLSGT